MTQCCTERSSPASITGYIDRLVQFDGPPEQFLLNLLMTQCHVGPAEAASILRPGKGSRIEVLAAYPSVANHAAPPRWLSQASESVAQVIAKGQTLVKPLVSPEGTDGEPPTQHLALVPMRGVVHTDINVRGVAAFLLDGHDLAEVQLRRERLELTVGLSSVYAMRLAGRTREVDLRRLQAAIGVAAAAGEHTHFKSAAMCLCNEVAARWRCERVCVGFLTGRYVQLSAMSHTEDFNRKTQLVRDVEAAMEECLDQNVETFHPAAEGSAYVSRANATLSKRHGPSMISCLPLRKGGEVVAVLMVERDPDQPLNPKEIETLRLTCDLSTSRLKDLYDHGRWFGAKCAVATRKLLAGVIGPEHTWIKLTSILILCAVLFLTFAKTDYRPEAPFIFQATRQQVIVAPFDSYLSTAPAAIGSLVEANTTVLATLETAEIELELAAARASKASYVKQDDVAKRDGDTAGAQMARAQADKFAAQIDLLEYRLDQATITSDIRGLVVTGDLQRQLGAPVKVGDILFEVAQLESIRAELALPEDQIPDVSVGLKGELATSSYPGKKIPFIVDRINPVAEVVNQRNVFKVRVRLLESRDWMRPGMEGIAKITVDRRSYGWIWTRRFVNWVRMKLWL